MGAADVVVALRVVGVYVDSTCVAPHGLGKILQFFVHISYTGEREREGGRKEGRGGYINIKNTKKQIAQRPTQNHTSKTNIQK